MAAAEEEERQKRLKALKEKNVKRATKALQDKLEEEGGASA